MIFLMSSIFKKGLLVTVLISMLATGFGKANEIRIRFIGNCGLHMTDGVLDVYVDFPYKSGAYGYMKYDPSEVERVKDGSLFLFTHRHADHYSKGLLKKLNGSVYGPWSVPKKKRPDLQKLGGPAAEFSIQAFKTKHRFSLKHHSYLITWHGKKIFLSGDTETAETIAKRSGMDWAFVPPWILLDAEKKKMKIDTRKFAVYHLYPGEQFNIETPERIVLLDKQQQVITIPY